jgi:uncharacterized membrane protein YedE/YeeE
MSVDWNHFTPWASLIGASAIMFALLNGRIAGISGIAGGLLRPRRGDIGWRAAFLIGLIVAPLAWRMFAQLPAVRIDAGYGLLVVAGLLVGAGTRLGGGCTSGHGVCGLSRLSPRSLVATLSFMAAGFVTVFVLRHLLGA